MSPSNAPGPRTVRRRAASFVGRALRAALVVGLLGAGTAAAAEWAGTPQQVARQEQCDLMENAYVRSIVAPEGGRITYISGPVRFECADGTTVRADSAVEFSTDGFRQLLGNVEMDGPQSLLTADRVNVSDQTGRTQAWGQVRLVDREADTEMYGDTLVFLEEREFRAESELRVWGERPYAVLRFRGPQAGDEEGPDAEDGGGAEPEEVPEEPNREPLEAGDGDDGEPEVEADAETDDTADRQRRDTAAARPDTAGAGEPGEGQPLPERGSGSDEPADTVFASRLYLEGSSRFLAGGEVRVRRPDMTAVGDSLDYDDAAGRATLLSTDADPARVTGEAYDLTGREVDLHLQEGRVDEVLARDEAALDGEDVRVQGSRVRIFLAEGEIDRLVAVHVPGSGSADEAQGAEGADEADPGEEVVAAEASPTEAPDGTEAAGDSAAAGEAQSSPPPRAEARAEDFHLSADSLDVRAPRQRLDRVIAVGRARGESLGRDTLNVPDAPETFRRDWIEGDTVIAHFVPPGEDVAVEDPASPAARTDDEPPSLDRLVAVGNARSLYRMAPRAREGAALDADTADAPAGEETGGAEAPEDRASDAAADTTGRGGGDGEPAPERRRPALHYVVGDRITIILRDGEVERMEVEGRTRGLYLEPRETPAGASPQRDPSAAPDTVDGSGGEVDR